MNRFFKNMIVAGMCLPVVVFSQVPNGNFENWKSSAAVVPDIWTSTGKISKISGNGTGNAISLENSASDGIFSMVMQAAFDTGAFLAPFYPYNGTPDSIYLVYHANLGLDTASLSIAFTKSGETIPVAIADIQLSGNSGGWVTKVFPVNYIHTVPQLIADSGYIVIHSADPVFGPMSDGFLNIDEISFGYANNTPAPLIPNYGFEDWHSASVEYPENWVSYHRYLYDQGVVKNFTTRTTDSYEGAAAAVLEPFIAQNPETGFEEAFPNALVSIRPGQEPLEAGLFEPAFPINQRYTSFRGHYKSDLQNGDMAVVWVNIFKDGNVVGSAYFMATGQQNTFTEFSEDIAYDSGFTDIPDSATVVLMVADTTLSGITSMNSRAVFDHLRFDNWNTDVWHANALKSGVYPNPATGTVQVRIMSGNAQDAQILVIDARGKIVKTTNPLLHEGPNRISINLSDLPGGIYFLQVQVNEITEKHKIILTP